VKILIALDDTDTSHDAVRFACDLFGLDTDGSAATHEVLLLHVTRSVIPVAYVPDPITGGIVSPALIPAVVEAQRAADQADEVMAHDVADGLAAPADVVIEHGDAGRVICEVATEHAVDLLVVGTRDRSAWSKLWHPSVSDHVVHHAPCPVLVVR
jgi:nucleotide-binding universal stress UspA family protein